MSSRNWREAIDLLDQMTGVATPRQRELGECAGKPISADTPKIVAAALLKIAFSDDLSLPPPQAISYRNEIRLGILQGPSGPPISPQCDEDAEAWVSYLRLVRRRESLAQLQPNEGDIVETTFREIAEISSIGQEGRLFFKGGGGFGAWPDQVSIVARKDDDSPAARRAKLQARNSAARHASRSEWSTAKSRDLSEFVVMDKVSENDILELERVISEAQDERPIQVFLEGNRHLLTALLAGQERYCLPQKRLGGEYVPDFVIGDVSSLGFRWVLVELETPNSGIYIKRGRLDEAAREGVGQIMDWRNWLSGNIAYARQRRLENGLGLFDIDAASGALVFVGRRARMSEAKDAARREYRQLNIWIHTYDWLLEQLRGAVRFQGPPGSNPFLIHSE